MHLFDLLSRLPAPAAYALLPFLLVATVLLTTRLYTTFKYQRETHLLLNPPTNPGKQSLQSPQIPYTFPWLGNALDFLNFQPGAYWKSLFSWHPRSTGVCTLLLGGRKSHIIYSPHAIQAIFKDRHMKREQFERELMVKVFDMSQEQAQNEHKGKWMEKEMNAKYLSKFEKVNELTSKFTDVLSQLLTKDLEHVSGKDPVGLYSWLRDRMFTASTDALMGSKLLEMYPDYAVDFFQFDQEFLAHFFDLPAFLRRDAIKRREKIFTNIGKWMESMIEQSGGAPVDPEGPAWEPLLGSRLNRARHIDYVDRKLNTRSSAALDLGLTFALASNVIPATGWMLMHVLDPRNDGALFPRIMAELRKAEQEDGSIDVPTLMAAPLLQALWTETLRLYTDVLVTRQVEQDTTIPLDTDAKTVVRVKKGDNIFIPSWLGHHDPEAWASDDVSEGKFLPERHLAPDPNDASAPEIFVAPKGNNLFAFGGGVTICPGRFFAKQEAVGALAMVLLGLDVEVLGYLDKDGKETSEFPGLASAFPGSAGLVPGGDLKVRIKRRG